ncbi:MAG: HAD family hydrolase [Planctomycetota bacterium]
MVQHILFFDIDGTMLSTGGAGQRAMELALSEDFGIKLPLREILMAGRTDRGITDEIFAAYGLEDTPTERTRFMHSYLERLPDCLKQLPGALLPGVRELLDRLQLRNDLHLSLLTGNFLDGAWIKLRHFQIDHYFETGGYGDHHPDRDDVARTALENARQYLNRDMQGSDACVIGDTPADIRCARAIQARAAAVATGMYSTSDLELHAPDHLFEDLSRTEDVIARLLSKA